MNLCFLPTVRNAATIPRQIPRWLWSWLPIALLAATLDARAQSAANWPRWRGPHDNGSTENGSYPVKWDAKANVLWSAPLPGKGCSTPIVWDNRIYVTAPIKDEDALLAFDWNGKPLWQTALGAERPGKNVNGSGCNPSPATDGSALFVYFKSGHLACLELNGKVRWQTNLVETYGRDTLYWDFGTSPVLTDKDVVMAMIYHGKSYMAAYAKANGALHWKVPRVYQTPDEGDHSYATPLEIREQGREELLVWGGQHLTAHDAADGGIIWSCGEFNPNSVKNWVSVASPVLAGDLAVVPYGRGTRLHGIRLGGSGDVTTTNRIWKREDTGTFVPTPAECKGLVYLLHDRGEIECIDPVNGKTIWNGELPKNSASYYSSPVVADGKIYAAREDGMVYVAGIEGKFAVLAENAMGERLIASPVPVGNRLLLRCENHLFCIGDK